MFLIGSPQPTSVIPLILGSAAVGALVSSLITVTGQFLERRARRREQLLTESVKLAMAHHTAQWEYAKATGGNRFIPEHVKLVEIYYLAMRDLLLNERLPNGIFKNDSITDRIDFQERNSR